MTTRPATIHTLPDSGQREARRITMTDRDTADMIQRCIEEIEGQRREIATLRPRAEAYTTITQILGLLPQPSQGYGEDLVWRLKRELAELQPKPETETVAE